MTILNIASDGLHNVLIVLHRTVSTYGPMSKEKLFSLCRPESEGDFEKIRQTLLRWTQFGLFHESEDGDISLLKEDRDIRQLTATCRRITFSPENNENFWDKENSKCADFTRALSFFLAQNIYQSNFRSHSQVEGLEEQYIPDRQHRILQNDTRWNGFLHWASFLGFLWEDGRRWPDPTVAIREELPNVISSRTEIEAEAFIKRLAESLPVLDGGKYRLELESKLDSSKWQAPAKATQLSTSLSRALWRLSRPGGPIRLVDKSDPKNAFTLQGSAQRDWVRFSHVVAAEVFDNATN